MKQTFSKQEMRDIALAERKRFRATVASLSDEQLETPSLCAGWRVRDVAAHVAQNASAGTLAFFIGMAKARFDHDEYNVRSTREWAKLPIAQILRKLDTDDMMLIFRLNPYLLVVDCIVHHQDIRRPLGLGTDIPQRHLLAALHAVTTESMFAADAKRASGLHLVATDMPWRFGDGPAEVSGPGEALLMALMGRRVGAEELSGAEHLPDPTPVGRSRQ